MTARDPQLELGTRLREIRQQQGMTLQDVERASGGQWKAVVVGSYERGDRAISVARLAALAAFYRVPVSEFLPSRATAASAPPRAPRVMLDLTRFAPEHDDAPGALERYVRSIQVQRGDYNGRVLTLRSSDVRALSVVLGVAADDLVTTLGQRGLLAGR